MDYVNKLIENNKTFSKEKFITGLKMLPKQKVMIIGCVDPRVNPEEIFGIEMGDAAIIRNIGGRLNPATFDMLRVLRVVSKSAGQMVGEGWNIILLQHTDCGIVNCLHHAPEVLTNSFGVKTREELSNFSIDDPFKAVEVDVAAFEANPNKPVGATITGLVYDVESGHVITVVESKKL